MPESYPTATLTKLDVARRQLETAVALWFDDGDAVSIHTLVAAAHRIVHDIAEHRGSGAILLDRVHLSGLGYDPKEFVKAIRGAETFFKHAKDDPDATLEFSSHETEPMFYSAIECYHSLVLRRSQPLALLLAWLAFRHPDTLSETARSAFAAQIPRVAELSRREFFRECHDLDFTGLV